MKTTALLLAVMALATSVHAGVNNVINPAPPMRSATELFGPGWHVGAHALFLTPDADRAKDVWGGGINFDYFVNRNVGFQVSGAWADPGTGETWHNYTVDLVLRAPIESMHLAPYVFVGGGAIVEDSTNILGRFGVGVEFRPTSRFGIFADWVYNLPGGGGGSDDIEDYQMIRLGIKVGL